MNDTPITEPMPPYLGDPYTEEDIPPENWVDDDPYMEAFNRYVTNREPFTQLPYGINAQFASDVASKMIDCKPEDDPDFFDANGKGVTVPKRDAKSEEAFEGKKTKLDYFHVSYCRMLRDFTCGRLLQGRGIDGRDDGQLYRREVDYSGHGRFCEQWVHIELQSEYGIPRQYWNPMWEKQMLVETAKLKLRVLHGIKFNNRAYIRTGTDTQSSVQVIQDTDPMFRWPYEIAIETDYDFDLAYEAVKWCRWLTVDEHSAQNLARFFVTPVLEPYKHLSYVWYGDGGNGKGLLTTAMQRGLKDLIAAVDSQKLLGGKRGQGGFATDNETIKLKGALWAFDADADEITIDQMTVLKKLSTGDELSARRIQENTITIKPKATFLICTNNAIVMSSNNAAVRRQALVRMRDGRKPEDFNGFRKFLDDYGIYPFLMASCEVWKNRGDEPYKDIVIGSPRDLTRSEHWLVDQIVSQGYAIAGENPYRDNNAEYRNSISKLGLVSKAKRVTVDGKNCVRRCLVVDDEQKFGVYRQSTVKDIEDAERLVSKNPEPQDEGEAPTMPEGSRNEFTRPDEVGFACDYVPVRHDKSAIDWKKKVADPAVDTTVIPDGPYGVVPKPGFVVLDMDVSKHDGVPDGWTVFTNQVGAYGSTDFPRTYVVRTPSGGVHAYLKIPKSLTGLKNVAHPDCEEYPRKTMGGMPVDTRVGGLGYVVGPFSHVDSGDYTLVDKPLGDVPELTPRMCEWLRAHNYVEQGPVIADSTPAYRMMNRPADHGIIMRRGSEENVCMDPIPEGARNDTLYRWASGRLLNHPENRQRIHDDLFERGRVSGLDDAELETIWKSVEHGRR